MTTESPTGGPASPSAATNQGPEIFRCAGARCPGLPYRASEHAHPRTCCDGMPLPPLPPNSVDAHAAPARGRRGLERLQQLEEIARLRREAPPSMAAPTQGDLERLLWSDSATESCLGDADEILGRSPDGPRQWPILELLGAVSSEAEWLMIGTRRVEAVRWRSTESRKAAETDREDAPIDLRGMACGAKRLAILLLKGAWAAERAAEALEAAAPVQPDGDGRPLAF